MNFLKALKTKPKENKNIPEVEIEKTFDKEGNKIINGYKVLEYIGCGSYSKVKLVEKDGQKYAMKIINKENLKRKKGFLKNKDGKVIVNSLLENAMKEIAILKKTNHKNIIKLYEIIYNNEKNKMYLILEYIQNGNLITFDEEEEMFVINENYVKENKEIEKSFYSEDEIRNFVRDISLGINYLHHQGIIHRDIKPDNILINDKFICKITDFNVSAMLPDVNNDDIGKKIVGTDPYHDNDYDCQRVVDMKRVSIRYGERTILKDVDWTIMNGERWALSGQNGSGKSTLLSLVCADNPQSYACDITLFDRPRGSGESIWDIKKHIGYVSPEMHRSYKRNLPAIRIVASGLMDSIGLYAIPNAQDYDKCRWWLDIFGIGDLADKPFLQISSGEQRLVLLARAFVKDPQLLILDEPLHGLDLWNRRLTKDVIETFCQRKGKTLIMVTHYQEELPNVITNHLFLKKQI